MAFDRTTIIRGPAAVSFAGGDYIYTAGDVVVTPKVATFKIPTSFYGESTDERVEQIEYEITFTPSGQTIEDFFMACYSDIAALAVGSSILGSTDRALIVWARNGEKHTFPNAVCLKPADLIFSATKTLFGSVTFTALYKKNTAWDAADSIHKIETASFTDNSFNSAAPYTGTYGVAWGASSPFSTLKGAGEATFRVNPTWEGVATDSDGVIDYRLKDITASVKFQPIGCTLAELKAANVGAMSTALRGGSLATSGKAFTITSASGLVISATKAQAVESPFQFGASVNRVGEVEFRFVRVAPADLFSLTAP